VFFKDGCSSSMNGPAAAYWATTPAGFEVPTPRADGLPARQPGDAPQADAPNAPDDLLLYPRGLADKEAPLAHACKLPLADARRPAPLIRTRRASWRVRWPAPAPPPTTALALHARAPAELAIVAPSSNGAHGQSVAASWLAVRPVDYSYLAARISRKIFSEFRSQKSRGCLRLFL